MSNAALFGDQSRRVNLKVLGFLALFGAAGLGTGAIVASNSTTPTDAKMTAEKPVEVAALPSEPELSVSPANASNSTSNPAKTVDTKKEITPEAAPESSAANPETESGVATGNAVQLEPPPALAAETVEAPTSEPTEIDPAISVLEPTQETVPAPSKEPNEPSSVTRTVEVKPGDTLMDMLTEEGVGRRQAYNAIEALSKSFSPRKLRPGHELQLELTEIPNLDLETDVETAESSVAQPSMSLSTLTLTESPMRDVIVALQEDGLYESSILEHPTERVSQRAEGVITTSLYEAAVEEGVPAPVLGDLIHIFSFDVDFQREVRVGDTFALMYDVIQVEGETVDTGAVHMAEMTVGGKQRRYYRFKGKDGFWEYFDENGKSAKKALLRTPVDGARLSSGFGKRRHPILGYTKMHRGADFAAPTGTPIFAAGNGVVEVSGWNGGFGKYIRIRHNDTYKTAYAHMSRIAVSKGKRVQQGQVIGYVGTTGRSTGPHLHYEVHQNGRQVNPMGVKLPTGRTLKGAELAAFKQHVAKLEGQFASLDALDLAQDANTESDFTAEQEDSQPTGQLATVE